MESVWRYHKVHRYYKRLYNALVDLQLTPYKLSITEHLKEVDIASCALLAKWMTSHIDAVRTTLVFRLYLVGAS